MKHLLILLYLFCSALSQAQTSKDSLNCYTLSESRIIAARVTFANVCDSLLQDSKDQLSISARVISNDSLIIRNKDLSLAIQTTQLGNRDQVIQTLNTSLKETKLISGGIILTLLILVFLNK